MWPVLLLATAAYAQIDLSAIQRLDNDMPEYSQSSSGELEIDIQRTNTRYQPPIKPITPDEIKNSGYELGSIPASAKLRSVTSNKEYGTYKPMYVKYYRLEDEQGFKYLLNKDGTVTYKVHTKYVEPLKDDLVLHEPPSRYTPAPRIERTYYDEKLSVPPELTFYAGVSQGDYMKDLFNDPKASEGSSVQYGLHFFTKWDLPIRAGGVIHYERTSYNLTNGGKVIYSSPSIGPQFKTKNFDWFVFPVRFQAQFRVSPFARATTDNSEFKFNSADFLASVEFPIKNSWGEFVLGAYMQNQWLNIKQQKTQVDVKATNETNKSFGLSIAQVFE